MNDTTSSIDPRHTALLVMDFQEGIVGMVPQSDELLARVAEAIRIARERGVAIGYVRVAFADEDYGRVPKSNPSFHAVAESRRMHVDDPETAIHHTIIPQAGDIMVRKTRVGAFSTTNLADQLREQNITTLILAGIATSGVVLSTIRDAADHDYQIFVLEDACADRDPAVHDFLIQKIFPRQASVISVSDLPNLLEAR